MFRYIMVAVMTATILFFSQVSTKASNVVHLEQKQAECIQTAYSVGSQIEVFNDTWGETVASIAYQESWCNGSTWRTNGVVVGDLNNQGKPRSLGVMQVQIPTARFVNKHYPHIFKNKYGNRTPTDEELTVDLLIDVEFNITVGVHYYAWLLEYRGGNWEKAILSYNRGHREYLDDINDYVRKVKKWRMTIVRPYLKGQYKIIPERK